MKEGREKPKNNTLKQTIKLTVLNEIISKSFAHFRRVPYSTKFDPKFLQLKE